MKGRKKIKKNLKQHTQQFIFKEHPRYTFYTDYFQTKKLKHNLNLISSFMNFTSISNNLKNHCYT